MENGREVTLSCAHTMRHTKQKIRGHIENTPFTEVKEIYLSDMIAQGLAVFSRFFFP